MHSVTLWKCAPSPNYVTNIDRVYPYSEVPFLGEYNLVKLPLSLNKLIDHVDYWGEGKVVTQYGTSGFANCYNVNYTYQLVSNGEDRDRKIPNRIPVDTSSNCDTSAYIRDNSVLTVTLMAAPINESCAADIARMINSDLGKVVVYGFDSNSKDIQNLTATLKTRGLFRYTNYKLPSDLQGLTAFGDHIAFLNANVIKNILYKLVIDGEYDAAVTLTKEIVDKHDIVTFVVQKLLHSNSTVDKKLLTYAYKLWSSGAHDVVHNHFPAPIELILGKENVTIVNTDYRQALKLDANTDDDGDRLAWGDSYDKTSKRVSWQFVPVWLNDEVTFKLHNVDCDMYLKLAVTGDGRGDRQAWGTKNSNNDSTRYYLVPSISKGVLIFRIANCKYNQDLKLVLNTDSYGDRLLMGHKGDVEEEESRFRWTIESWSPRNHDLKQQLCKLVTDREYDAAATLTKTFDEVTTDEVVTDAVQTLLHSDSSARAKLMSYAYQLWSSGARDVVQNNFPSPIKLIFGKENVTIVNTGYRQALKLDANTDDDGNRLAWGDCCDKTSKRVNWHFVPVWWNDEVTFKLHNVDCDMYLKLAITGDGRGDRQAWGTTDSKHDSSRYYLVPFISKGVLVFRIANCKYNQDLKLVLNTDSSGDRLLMGHKGDVQEEESRFRWTIESWSPRNLDLKQQLCKLVTDREYDAAATLTKTLIDQEITSNVVTDAVQTLLHSDSSTRAKLISYAYQLWNSGARDVVQNNIPAPIKLILGKENVTIVNTDYRQALKLDANTDDDGDRLAWGDSYDKTSKRVSWQFVPVWLNDEVTFKLHNVDCDMYLKLAVTGDGRGDRQAWGTKNSNNDSTRYYLVPSISKGVLIFRIANCKYNQDLKLVLNTDSYGDRLLMGHKGDVQEEESRFRWTIESWSPRNHDLKQQLCKLVTDREYDAAATLTKTFDEVTTDKVVTDAVQTLLHSDSSARAKLMSYAYQLWSSGARDVVKNNFPSPIKLIFGKENVNIVNTGYRQALKLDANTDDDGDRLAWGDCCDKTSKRVNWHFVPVWWNDEVTFKLHNVDCDMYLKLAVTGDGRGDRQAWGTKNSNNDSTRYYLVPSISKGVLIFRIANCKYNQDLKLILSTDSYGDRLLMGHRGDVEEEESRFRWTIESWSPRNHDL